MSTYIKVEGDPEDVTAIGARLKAQAAAFGAQAQGILHEITAIDGAAPWGQDDAGRTFAEQYNKVPEGSDPNTPPFSEAVKNELSKAGEQLDKVGQAIIMTMAGYQGTDATNDNDIRKV
jgi:hypothetical protein